MTRQTKLNDILSWQKPSNNSQWAEDTKKESLHLKFDKQLVEMKKSHEDKLPHVQEDLDKFENWPDAVKFELNKQFSDPDFDLEGKTVKKWVDDEFAEQHTMYKWKVAKLEQSIERIIKEKELRDSKFLKVLKKNGKSDKRFNPLKPENESINSEGSRERAPLGTQYFVDDTCGTPGNGTTATCTGGANDSFDDLGDFTESARSAGDVCTVRRDNTSIDDGGDLAFSSSGTIDNPIIIEADYDDNWSSDVDLSATATATLTFGSKTITFSSDISGVLAAGDWIYVATEDAREFAYEVDSVSTVTVTLFLPYKGDQAGSSKTMTNMQAVPIWGTAAASFEWNFDGDNYWLTRGIHIKGRDGNGNVEIDSCEGHDLIDCILESDGTANTIGFQCVDDTWTGRLLKCRFFDHQRGLRNTFGAGILRGEVRDCLGDGNSVASSTFVSPGSGTRLTVIDTETTGYTDDLGQSSSTAHAMNIKARNWIMGSAQQINENVDTANKHMEVLFEDFNGTIGDTRQNGWQAPSNTTFHIASETSTVRSGGSNVSIKVTPPDGKLADIQGWTYSRLKLFEVPFYATTDSKTYTVYFRPTATGDWTTDPTNTELWIELEAWGHASNNFRKITKSTGTIDMNGSTDWQTLTVTVAPAQAGVAYLRCYYAKTKESSKANTFFADPIPEVT